MAVTNIASLVNNPLATKKGQSPINTRIQNAFKLALSKEK